MNSILGKENLYSQNDNINTCNKQEIINENLEWKNIDENILNENENKHKLKWKMYKFDEKNNSDDNKKEKLINFIKKNTFEKNNIEKEEYIKWTLENNKEIENVIIIEDESGNIKGMISYNLQNYQMNRKVELVTKVNYICVSVDMREKGYGKKLIKKLLHEKCKENDNKLIGMYKSNEKERSIVDIERYMRPINVKKLVRIGYIKLKKSGDKDEAEKYYKLNYDMGKIKKIETNEEIEKSFELYNEYMERYNFYPKYDKKLWFNKMKNKNVTSYLFLDNNDEYVDMLSMLKIEERLEKPVRTFILKEYTSNKLTPYYIMKNFILLGQQEKVDTLMIDNTKENESVKDVLDFKEKKDLNYKINLYNYRLNKLNANQVHV